MVISHITDKVIAGRESSYGTAATTLNSNWGLIESFSYTEEENIEQIGAVGGGHTYQRNEPGIYNVSGTLKTKITKTSLPEVLEAFFGSRTDTTVYSIVPNPNTIISYTVEADFDGTNKAQITGLVFTTCEIDASKDGFLTLSCDYVAQLVTISAGTITQTVTTEAPLSWLDVSGTYNGLNLKGNSFTISYDWNIDANDGRGLETVTTGQRRLIQRVVKNNLTVSGNLDVLVEAGVTNTLMGYADELTEASLVLTASRGTLNSHTFTLTGCVLSNKTIEANAEPGMKNFTADISGRDTSVSGDL